jgi:hypothetical protein
MSRIRLMAQGARDLGGLIAEARAGLVCDRCGKYVGSLARGRYLPPPYPVAVDRISPEHEVEALLAFELHLVGRLRRGNFVIRHPQRDGRCISVREWLEGDDEDDGAPEGK